MLDTKSASSCLQALRPSLEANLQQPARAAVLLSCGAEGAPVEPAALEAELPGLPFQVSLVPGQKLECQLMAESIPAQVMHARISQENECLLEAVMPSSGRAHWSSGHVSSGFT